MTGNQTQEHETRLRVNQDHIQLRLELELWPEARAARRPERLREPRLELQARDRLELRWAR